LFRAFVRAFEPKTIISVSELLDLCSTDMPDPYAGAPTRLGRSSSRRTQSTTTVRPSQPARARNLRIPERRRRERARRRRSLLGTERDGLHAAGEAGLLLRRRDRRRRRLGLRPLQGLQARSRLHGPPGMRSTPSSAFGLDLRFLRAYRNYVLGGTHQA
jgi:hypothetical protein